MPHVITGACCSDASCVTACPLNCIHPRADEPGFATAEMLHIDPTTCIGCGACADACPVGAIVPLSNLAIGQQHFAAANADYFAEQPVKEQSLGPSRAIAVLPAERGRLRVAIIGSGPAGMYAAQELLRHPEVEVDVYEQLLTPWGLVRSGVAPDHPDTKAAASTFEALARERNLRLRLGVDVGSDITIAELRRHYHAVVVATGASNGRTLDIDGAELPGSVTATDFARWYNGHPDYADNRFDLSGRIAIVVGNGNVALDAARMLLTGAPRLSGTDIADQALDALAHSAVEEVIVLGRRPPRSAAFTEPELTALTQMDEVDICVDERSLNAGDLDGPVPDDPPLRRKLDLFRSRLGTGTPTRPRRLTFEFNASVVALHGGKRVEEAEIVVNAGGRIDRRRTPVGLVVHAIGHSGYVLPGVPYDATALHTPHVRGRIIDGSGGPTLTGLYTVGWHKRGANGVIGTNRFCSQETVESLLDDFTNGILMPPADSLAAADALLSTRGVKPIDLNGWLELDREEQLRGRAAGKPRTKIVDRAEQAAIAQRKTETNRLWLRMKSRIKFFR